MFDHGQALLPARGDRQSLLKREISRQFNFQTGEAVKKSLFVTVLMTILCGVLWIFFLAATHQQAVPEIKARAGAESPDAAMPR